LPRASDSDKRVQFVAKLHLPWPVARGGIVNQDNCGFGCPIYHPGPIQAASSATSFRLKVGNNPRQHGADRDAALQLALPSRVELRQPNSGQLGSYDRLFLVAGRWLPNNFVFLSLWRKPGPSSI